MLVDSFQPMNVLKTITSSPGGRSYGSPQGTETCLILEGDVTVTPNDDRKPVTVGAGDICVFPDGMQCTWDVRAAIKKHYKFE